MGFIEVSRNESADQSNRPVTASFVDWTQVRELVRHRDDLADKLCESLHIREGEGHVE
jgi:hypothetical protein